MKRVIIDTDPKFFFQVGVQLPPHEKQALVEFFRKNVDVFAWDTCEAPGIDPNFICHHLNVNPSIAPKKQPPRRSSKNHYEAVKDDVTKLKRVGAIKEFFLSGMVSQHCGGKKEERKVESMRRFYKLEQSLSERSFPPSSDRSIGGRNGRTSSNEFP